MDFSLPSSLSLMNGCVSPSGEGLVGALPYILVLGPQGTCSQAPGLSFHQLDLKPCSSLETGQEIMTFYWGAAQGSSRLGFFWLQSMGWVLAAP